MKLMGDKGLVRAYNGLMSAGTVFASGIVSKVYMALVAGVKTRVLKMLAVDRRTMTGLARGTRKTQCHFIDSQASFSLPAGLDVRKKEARLLINSRRDGQAQHKSKHDAAAVVIGHITMEFTLLSPAGFEVVANASHEPSFLSKDAVFVSPR
jgi:hypothetical protein